MKPLFLYFLGGSPKNSCKNPVSGFDTAAQKCYDSDVKGCDEDLASVRIPERSAPCCKRSVPLQICRTASEPPGGNAGTGAPVKASMSGGACAATRVEPWNVQHPTPDLFRGGIFVFCPQIKRR